MVIEEAGLPATEALYEHAPCGLLITQPNGTIAVSYTHLTLPTKA